MKTTSQGEDIVKVEVKNPRKEGVRKNSIFYLYTNNLSYVTVATMQYIASESDRI